MRYFSVGLAGEVMILALEPGEMLLESIKKVISQENITDGIVISGIGSAARARFHIVTGKSPVKDQYIEREGSLEIMSLQGVIASGEPHIHITFSENQEAFGGHLEEGTEVLTLSEIVMVKLPQANLIRIPHPVTGYRQLQTR